MKEITLFIGHGSRDVDGNVEFTNFVQNVRQQMPDQHFEACFLELTTPTIPDGIDVCVRQGAERIVVVPVILLAASHGKLEIPEFLDAARRKYPNVDIVYGRTPVRSHKSRASIMNRSRIVIAGTNSGAGKTTVTLGLMAALKRRNIRVQGFKVGPDYIDPSYHAAVTGRFSRNLDTWMMVKGVIREVFHRGSEGADVSVIEGVMGMYDGKDPLSNTGSTAGVSQLLQAPVLLVVNAASMARSAAAVVLGFQQLDPSVNIAGVIVNQVGSKGHFELVKAAIEQMCGVPAVGYLTRQSPLQIPERHLGLIPALERGEMTGLFDALADAIEATSDVEQILQIAGQAEVWTSPEPILFVGRKREPEVTLAVARDEAFNFYYPENLELLEWYGARLVEFKPLHGELVPGGAEGVYIGGGFPEEFADELSRFDAVRMSLRRAVQDGMPVFAECGGFMYLTDRLTDRQGET